MMTLAKYRLVKPLPDGGPCLRYDAEDGNGQLLELRVIPEAWREASDWPQRVNGWQLARQLQPAGLQQLVDIEPQEDPPYVVLERLTGRSLEQTQQSKPLSFSDVLRLGIRLARAIAEMHRLGLVHGSIHPESIVDHWKEGWVLRASGFNPAHREHDFRAPEADADLMESASDVYSLGAVLRSLMAPSVPGDHSDQVQSLVEACLSGDPSTRPTAVEVADRLEELLKEFEPHAAQTMSAGEAVGASQERRDSEQTIVLNEVPVFALRVVKPGEQLGAYRLVEKIGEGGMGAVFRAEGLGDRRTVAIKVLNRFLADTAGSRQRFAKEARMLARANNPYVANLLEFNEDRGLSYLSVEYVPGGSLGTWLKHQGHCDEASALAITADAARGLSNAHQRAIVHRDIKPDNLLLTELGVAFLSGGLKDVPAGSPLVKLSDFGLARSGEQSESLAITSDGAVLGTPYYMAPEQCQGRAADARSDVYSLGATLFHLLIGRPPFEGETHVAVMNKHVNELPSSVRKVRPELSEAIDRVVSRCLAKNPDARYPDAGQLLFEVEMLRCGQPASIVLHPQLPDPGGDRVVSFSFEWQLRSSPALLWPYVSNTDRVNQAMGLPPVRYRAEADPELGVRRYGEIAYAGQKLAWEEHPYEWIEGQRMSVLRQFSQGPLKWFVSIVELKPRPGGGTLLSQTIKVVPKSLFGRWLAKFAIGVNSGRSLTRVYENVDEYLSSSAARGAGEDPFRKTAAMSTTRRSKLAQRLASLQARRLDPVVVETFGQFLATASEQDVARIRPLALADRFQLKRSDLTAACLWGAQEGLVVLLWDILCPSCRIPSDVKETLAVLKDHGHCEACNLDFEIDFANSVEMIFRAHPDIRDVETRTYCIGGPAFSAHVVAQIRLSPRERFQLELALSDGSYRIRGPQLPFNVDFRVSPRGTVGRWELSLIRPPPRSDIPLLQSRRQVITLANDTASELQVRIERLAQRDDAVTAAEASSMALFRQIFPGQVLSPGRMVGVTSLTFVLLELSNASDLYRILGDGPAFEVIQSVFERAIATVEQQGGAMVKSEGDGILAVFSESAAAVRTASELLRSEDLRSSQARIKMACHAGPAMVTTMNDRLDYFGRTLLVTRQMAAHAAGHELYVSDKVLASIDAAMLLGRGEVIDVVQIPGLEPPPIVHRIRTTSGN